jgi:hypothetical protein
MKFTDSQPNWKSLIAIFAVSVAGGLWAVTNPVQNNKRFFGCFRNIIVQKESKK